MICLLFLLFSFAVCDSHVNSNPGMTSGELCHEAVLKAVYSFLDTHGYSSALMALEVESGVPYNVVRTDATASPALTPEGLESAVMNGQWNHVLKSYAHRLLLPSEVKAMLYELIAEEMLQLHGLFHASRALFSNASIFQQYVKTSNPARYARIETQLQQFDPLLQQQQMNSSEREAIEAVFRQRRSALLKELQKLISFSSSHRAPEAEPLVRGLLLYALCEEGKPIGKRPRSPDGEVTTRRGPMTQLGLPYPTVAPQTVVQKIQSAQAAPACICSELPSQPITVLGRVDGTIDFLHLAAGAVKHSAPHASKAGVLSIAHETVPHAHGWLSVGYRDGCIKVFETDTYQVMQSAPNAHSLGVTSTAFVGPLDVDSETASPHHGLIASSSFDTTIRLISTRSGACVCTVVDGHRGAAVNAVCSLSSYENQAMTALLSAGNDARLSCWWVPPPHTRQGKVELERVGFGATLQSFYPSMFEGSEVPISLTPFSSSASSSSDGCEVLVLTRSQKALVMRIALTPTDFEKPIATEMLCVVEAPHKLRSVSPLVVHSASQILPMLSLYFASEDGMLLLYNVEMGWRGRNADGGSCVVLRKPSSLSSVITAEVGKAVGDLRMARVELEDDSEPSAVFSLFVCAASLDDAYVVC